MRVGWGEGEGGGGGEGGGRPTSETRGSALDGSLGRWVRRCDEVDASTLEEAREQLAVVVDLLGDGAAWRA